MFCQSWVFIEIANFNKCGFPSNVQNHFLNKIVTLKTLLFLRSVEFEILKLREKLCRKPTIC